MLAVPEDRHRGRWPSRFVFVGGPTVLVTCHRITQRRLTDPERQPVSFAKHVPHREDLDLHFVRLARNQWSAVPMRVPRADQQTLPVYGTPPGMFLIHCTMRSAEDSTLQHLDIFAGIHIGHHREQIGVDGRAANPERDGDRAANRSGSVKLEQIMHAIDFVPRADLNAISIATVIRFGRGNRQAFLVMQVIPSPTGIG